MDLVALTVIPENCAVLFTIEAVVVVIVRKFILPFIKKKTIYGLDR